jgi:hypothetical protein
MVRAIDVHIHPPAPGYAVPTDAPETKEYFRSAMGHTTPDEMAEHYASLDIFGVLFHSDAETATGAPPVPNDFIASIVEKYPKQFIGFGSVDPWKGKAAVAELQRCVDLALRGLKFHPQQQAFYPNDQRFYPLWEEAQRLGLVALFHTGTTGVGAGLAGGGGVKLKYARPIPYIDDVAADFPQLTVIMAHPSFPWQDEQLAMLVHKPNVYMDLSGWSPKYFSPLLVQYARTIAQDKVMFGSDYPVITPERWLADFDALGFDDAVRQKVLVDNAKRVLKLDSVI